MSYKVKYKLRKSRKMRTLMSVMFGIVFGGLVLQSNAVQASEDNVITTDNPATNAIEAQPEYSKEAQESHDKAYQGNGQINIYPDKQVLDKAIANVSKQGFPIEETPTINQGIVTEIKESQDKQNSIQSDYKQQAHDIEKNLMSYQQQQRNYMQQYDKIKQENHTKQLDYQKQIAQHQSETAQINQFNKQQQAKYQQALEKYNQEIIQTNSFNQQQNQQYQQQNQQYKYEKEKIIKHNQEQKIAYDKDMQIYQQQLANYDMQRQKYIKELQNYEQTVNNIQRKNQAMLNEYHLQLQKNKQQQLVIEQQNKHALLQYQQKVDKEKKAIDEGINNPKNVLATSGDNQQYSDTESWYNLQSTIIDDDIHIVASGKVKHVEDLQNGNYSVHVYSDTEGKITNANIIKSIYWGDTDLIGNVVLGDKITESYQTITGRDNSLYDVTTGNTSKVFSVKSGEWFTIPQAVILANNDRKDLLVKLTKSGTQLTYGEDWITVWNANGAINYYDGSHALNEEPPANKISATYKIAGTKDKYLWTAATFDIDGGQYMNLHTQESAIVSVGGGLKLDNKNIYSDEQLGYTWGKNSNINALDGTNSTPDGVIVFAEFSNEISHTLANTSGGNSTTVANADFGIAINVSVAEYPILINKIVQPPQPQLQSLPTKPIPPKTKQLSRPEKPKDKTLPPVPKLPIPKKYPVQPQPPIYKPIPKTPIIPNYQVLPTPPKSPQLQYHYHQLAMKPKLYKQVTNSKDIEIDNSFVPKLSEVYWHLNATTLPSSREIIHQYLFTDYLPSGFSLDLSTTKKLNNHYQLTFNHQNNTLQLQATPDYLNYLNKNLSKDIEPDSPIIVGKVINDGATYINNFKLQINDYTSYSNNVRIMTPGKSNDPKYPHNSLIQPIKYNANKYGSPINDKAVLAGSTNYYHLIWDLDQYKNIKVTDNEINKGFYFIDDYPEDILIPQLSEVIIQDNNGQAVKNIDIKIYSDITTAPKNIQNILSQANIYPKGSFQLFSSQNPNEFYHNYVKQGKTLTIINPMKIDSRYAEQGGKYTNRAYQIDFGNGYATNKVSNYLPKMQVHKDVVIDINNKHSIDGQLVELNQPFNYRLVGSELPANRADELIEYVFIDDYDNSKDRYTGEYHVFTTKDLKLYDGKLIREGTDVTQHTVQNILGNRITIQLNKEFLLNIDRDSPVQFDTYLKMIRINTGEVINKFINRINGIDVISNIVHTHTTVKHTNKELPKTGTTTLPTTLLGLVSLSLTLGILRKHHN